MIKTSTFLLYIVILFCFFNNFNCIAQNWLDVNSSEITGGRSNNLTFALAKNGTPYVAYSDGTLAGRAVVKKFDGTRWVQVGTGSVSVDYAGELALALDKNNIPYLAYTDNATDGQLSVKKFDGTNWVAIGAGSLTSSYPEGLRLTLSSTGIPYLTYTDKGQGWVKQFDGTNWQVVGASSFALPPTEKLSLALDLQNIPYIAYVDPTKGGQIAVQRWNGSSWVTLGTSGVAAGAACDISLVLASNGTPYVIFREFHGGALDKLGKMKVKYFTGTTWEEVGTTSISDSWVFFATMGLDKNNIPYVAYRESSTGIGNPGLTKVKRLNGREWEEIGTANFTSGSFSDISLALTDTGLLYVAFADGIKARPATVLKLDVPALVITTKAPTQLTLAPTSDKGISAADGITNVSQPTITGMAIANALVTIFVDAKIVGTTRADSNGKWSFTFTTALAAGYPLITATATDNNGLTSAASASLSLTLDFTAPTYSGVTEGEIYRTDKTLTYNGGTATLNNEAYVSGTLISAEGNHTLLVSDVAGNSTSVRFTIDKTAPVAKIFINSNAALTTRNEATLSIVAPDATEMRLYDNNDEGIWTAWEPITATKTWTLSDGSGSKWVKLEVRDAAGNVSAAVSDGIILDQIAPTATIRSSLTSPTSSGSIPVQITLSDNVTNFTASAITVSNAVKGKFYGSGKYYTLHVLPIALLPTTSAIISVSLPAGVIKDAAGNKNEATPAFTITYVAPITKPVVVTSPVTNLSASAVSVGGTVTSSGGSLVIARGVVYSYTSSTPSISSSKVVAGSGEGVFTTTIANLKAGTIYYVRAFATNAIGTSYGAIQKFTTPVTTSAAAQVNKAPEQAAEKAITPQATLSSYPNPFQQQATIAFTFPVATDYQAQVYDMNGNLVTNLKTGKAVAGEQVQINWVASAKVTPGLYIIRLTTTAGVQNLKVICNK